MGSSDTLMSQRGPGPDGALPERFGDFQIQRLLGRGGMALVYLARQGSDGREVALKVMQSAMYADQAFVQRFLHEAKATIGLKHPNVVELLSFGEIQGQHYLVTEFVDGGTVEGLLAATQSCPAPLALELFAQLLDGLAYAHGLGLVHRDLKPANLLLTRAGQLKIADFGIAKAGGGAGLTQTGMLIGTPAYMSPEQALGKPVDQRSDLFTAGVILYELLSGRNPHSADSPATAIHRVVNGPTPSVFEVDPTVPPLLEAVLERLLERDPARRYESVAQVLGDLQDAIDAGRRRFPNVVSEVLLDPPVARQALSRASAEDWYQQARPLIDQGPPERKQAALALYRAVLLDPDHRPAADAFARLCASEHVRFGATTNKKILELEASLEQTPEAPAVLQQLANLYRLEGNVQRAVTYFKRYLRLRPKDAYAASLLSQLTGARITLRSTGVGGGAGTTANLVAGIKTGGFKAGGAPLEPSATWQVPNPAPAAPTMEGSVEAVPGLLHELWNGVGKKLLVLIAVLLFISGAVRWLNRTVDASIEEGNRSADAMGKMADARALQLAPPVALSIEHRTQELGVDAEKRFSEARAHFERRELGPAIEGFTDVMTRYPKRPVAVQALLLRARANLAQGSLFDAQRDVADFLERHPGSSEFPEALALAAEVSERFENHAQAIEHATRLLTDHASSPFVNQARVWRAAAYAAQGDPVSAKVDYEFVLGHAGPADPLYELARRGLDGLSAGR